MTDDDLDRIISAVRQHGQATPEQRGLWEALVDLARRGLRAERETCGTCHWWRDLDEDSYCEIEQVQAPGSDDYCSRWRAREER